MTKHVEGPGVNGTVRTFVALELSEGQKDGILSLVGELRSRGIRAGWARRETLHLTLRFLGDVEVERLERVSAAVRAAAAGTPAFMLATSGVGAFPNARRPRVVWVGVEAGPELFELQSALERELELAGFPRERRPFRPHLTMGRIRDPEGAAGLSEALSALTVPREETLAAEVRVMKSTLAPGGAVHEVLDAIPLGSADARA